MDKDREEDAISGTIMYAIVYVDNHLNVNAADSLTIYAEMMRLTCKWMLDLVPIRQQLYNNAHSKVCVGNDPNFNSSSSMLENGAPPVRSKNQPNQPLS